MLYKWFEIIFLFEIASYSRDRDDECKKEMSNFKDSQSLLNSSSLLSLGFRALHFVKKNKQAINKKIL